MIKVKISDLLNSTEALQKLAGTELKAKLAWQVGRILKAAEAEIQSFNETRMDLIRKYGEKDEKGELVTDETGNCKIMEGGILDFSNQLTELVESEVEINGNKIKIDDLDNVNFTLAEMAQLEVLIDFGENE